MLRFSRICRSEGEAGLAPLGALHADRAIDDEPQLSRARGCFFTGRSGWHQAEKSVTTLIVPAGDQLRAAWRKRAQFPAKDEIAVGNEVGTGETDAEQALVEAMDGDGVGRRDDFAGVRSTDGISP